MPRWLRITIGLSVTAIIFLAVLGFIFYNMLTSPLPVYEGNINSRQIKNDVEIYRDSLGIAYILANDETDAAFALGFVHAQERMFTMDITRRAAEGRLSEIIGSRMIPFDKMFLTIGLKKFAFDNINKVDPEVRKLLQAYSDGVNLYIRENKGKYPVEFDILGYEPGEWKPENSLEIIRMLGWELNISWWTDFSFAYIISKIGEEKAKQIFPEYGSHTDFGLPVALKQNQVDLSFVKTDREFRQFFGLTGSQLGSNNWAVKDTLSESGKPIVANDPHLPYSAPGFWLAAVIRGGKWNAEGVTLPGVPGVVIGKNQNISWVLTNLMVDDADFYVERLDSTGKNYFLDGAWQKLIVRKVKIKVKDSSDVDYQVKYTHRGPIVSGSHPFGIFYKNSGAQKPVLSMRWSGNDFSDEMKSFYKINIAGNWDEFKEALRSFGLPGQNFVYADRFGNIGYVMGGKIPVRGGYNPLLIYDGTSSAGDWQGYVPYDAQLKIFNPPTNYLATANNKITDNFPYYITNLWEPDSRIQRITELIRSKTRHSVQDFKNYQMDQVSPYAADLVKYVLNAFDGFEFSDKNLKASLDLLKKWDYSFSQYSQVPSIYAVFLDHLLKNIYMDELGDDLYNEFTFIANTPYRSLLKILSDTSSVITDNIKTDVKETRDDMIRKSLADAVKDLENDYGTDIRKWQWGSMHKVEFHHTFGGISGIIDNLVNIGPFPVGGDGTTIFNTEYPFNKGIKGIPVFSHTRFQNDLGPTMRYIYDFNKPDEFYLILTTGQSGHVLSGNYKNMTDMWLKGNYMRIRTDINSIRNTRNKRFIIHSQ